MYAVKISPIITKKICFNILCGNYKFAIIPEYCNWWFSAFFLSMCNELQTFICTKHYVACYDLF